MSLHGGKRVCVRLSPSAVWAVTFMRTDLAGQSVRASIAAVSETRLSTALGRVDGCSVARPLVRTVEHLMAALCATDVAACDVQLDGEELPLLDGSARQWLDLIRQAGLVPLPTPTAPLMVEKPVWISHGDAWAIALPAAHTQLTYGIDFGRFAPIGKQWFSWCSTASHCGDDQPHCEEHAKISRIATQLQSLGLGCAEVAHAAGRAAAAPTCASFEDAIASARTFATTEGVAAARAAGLAAGGDLESALVCDERRWLNEGALRFPNEPVRHKVLDLIGDLAMLGALPHAHVIAYKASHMLHIALARALVCSAPDPEE